MKTIAYKPVNKIWDIPFLPPLAQEIFDKCAVDKISNRILGEWEFRLQEIENIPSPYDKNQNYNFKNVTDGWCDVVVPSSLTMQGYDIKNNIEYYYRKTITAKASGELRAFIRFEGVYCNARIWLNGEFVCAHIGGFTPFDIEITNYLNTNGECDIVIGVADIEGKNKGIYNNNGDNISDSSWASYYAHNNIGGILRNVSIYYLPKTFILSNHIKADLTDNYSKGQLTMDMLLVSDNIHNCTLNISLCDQNQVEIFSNTISTSQCVKLEPKLYESCHSIDMLNYEYFNSLDRNKDLTYSEKYLPFKRCKLDAKAYGLSVVQDSLKIASWTAENPQLYTLSIELVENGEKLCVYKEKIGFRTIEYGKNSGKDINKVYVNGKEIKLRGVCRHDISSKYGRSVTELEEEDEIIAYKNNNINHVRTSHYPVSKNYLKLCDIYGIYVELENSVCFKGGNGYQMLCAPEEILQSLSEMIEYSYNHPSVIILSTGNESGFEKSAAFRKSYEYIKEKDSTRPTIFSYPFTVKSKPLPYDIFSKHYMKVTKFLGKKDMPKLHDEFSHVACYNLEDISRDNNYRIAWGKSIAKGWDNIIKNDGALGCAIWGGIDDVFYLPKGVNSAHQKHSASQAAGYGEWGSVLDVYKREKPEAYLTKKAFSPIKLLDYSFANNQLNLQIHNRFDHTNLNEVSYVIKDIDNTTILSSFLPCDIKPKQVGKVSLSLPINTVICCYISFYHGGYEIEKELLGQANKYINQSDKSTADYKILPSQSNIELLADDAVVADNITFIKNSKPLKAKRRKISKQQTATDDLVIVDTFYGLQKVKYTMQSLPQGILVDVKLSLALRIAVGQKYAVRLELCDPVKSVSWNKNCEYSCYPEGHLERQVGIANIVADKINEYGVKPNWPWKDDSINYFMSDGFAQDAVAVTNDFKTTRTDINQYNVITDNHVLGVKKTNNIINCYTKCDKEKQYIDANDISIIRDGKWYLIHKNRPKQCMVSRKKLSSMSIEFSGIGIKILGTRSKEQGFISIYIDNTLYKVASTRSDICDVLDFMVLENITGLSNSSHLLKIVLNDNDGVRISGFEIISSENNNINSSLDISVSDYYRSLAWKNYYGKRMSLKKKKSFQFLLTPYKK